MKSILNIITLLFVFTGICIAGPVVSQHPAHLPIKLWNNEFKVLHEFKDPKKIKIIGDIILRSKKVGNTSTHLKTITNKIDFENRWLLDLSKGEVGILSKTVTDVYLINAKDLKTIRKLIKPTKRHNKSQ